jgi:hypothetical protein
MVGGLVDSYRRCDTYVLCLIGLAALTSAPPGRFQLPYLKGE